jgi:site-specific recombinase XerD
VKNKKNEIAIIEKNSLQVNVKDSAWNSLSENSKQAYSYDYKIFLDFIKKDLHDVTPDDILNYIEYLENNDYKNSSINRKVASLSKMFGVMVIAGEIPVNPIEVLKQFKNINRKNVTNIKISLDIKDIKKATKTTKNSSIYEKQISIIIKFLAITGLRISELTHIKNRDITEYDEENKIIRIVGKGKKERYIYIDNVFFEEIKKVYPGYEGMPYLLYSRKKTPYDRKSLWNKIKIRFNETTGKDVHPHMLRHWYITHKISVEKQDIKAVSRYAGHSDVSITLQMYVDTVLDVKNSKIKI